VSQACGHGRHCTPASSSCVAWKWRSRARAAAIAAEYPLDTYVSPTLAFSALVGDANFACTAPQMNRSTSQRVPTFAYEFNDDAAPPRFWPPTFLDPPVATHGSELPYLLDQTDAPFQGPFNPDQEALAASMRAAWVNFAASGDPSTAAVPWPSFDDSGALALVRRQRCPGPRSTTAVPWPSFDDSGQVLSPVSPQPQVDTEFATRHHSSFWLAG
jgi:para-nitrobenzyl esterase